MLSLCCLLFWLILKSASCGTYRPCPMFCDCDPDTAEGPWALKVSCDKYYMKIVPFLSSNVTYLHIESDQLTELDGFAFDNAPSLKSIRLETNALVKINRDAFQSLPKLQNINIKTKLSMQLDVGTFRNLKSVSTVKLVANLTRIPSQQLCGASSLRSLTLEDNIITDLELNSCIEESWTHLNGLILTSNPIKRIHPNDFYHLRNIHLSDLSLNNCGLTELPSGAFRYLKHVKLLDIGWNKISSLPEGVFQGLPLRQLVLAGTYLTVIPVWEMSSFLSTLDQINVADCLRMHLDFRDEFLKASNLTELILYNTNITEIDDGFFKNLVNSPLTTLELHGSKISGVTQNALRPLTFLRELDINKNPKINSEVMANISQAIARAPLVSINADETGLDQLHTDTFGGFLGQNSSLSTLTVSNSGMTSIDANAFAAFSNLQCLRLDGNKLTSDAVENGAFSGLPSLTKLYLDHNQFIKIPIRYKMGIKASLRILSFSQNAELKSLTRETLKDWSSLEVLDLSSCAIKTIGKQALDTLKNLRYLDLEYNALHSVAPNTFDGLQSLQQLKLGRNHLTDLPAEIFQNLRNLQVLDFHENRNFAPKTLSSLFHGLSNLQILYLHNCKLESLPVDMFIDCRKLYRLQLTSNRIALWDPEVFKPLENLTFLYLEHNVIASVTKASFKHLVALVSLDLSGNPLACTCDLVWLKHWVASGTINLLGYGQKKSYVCASPEALKGTSLVDFQLTQDDCVSKAVLHWTISIVCVIVFLSSMASVLFRYRWYLRYYFFLLRSRRRQAEDDLLGDEVFRFDVYVCYHRSSMHWVVHKLLPELEYKGGLRLCLHDRNWLAGPAIVENIIASIEQSRKTLLLVNNGFAKSAWCREETALAYHRLVTQHRNLLVVVLLEDIEQANLEQTLRSILTNRVYLKYEDGRKKEAKFWKALRAALGKPEHPAAGVEMRS